MVNGSSKTVKNALTIIGGRTMVPLRFVAENLGCAVGCGGPTKATSLTYPG